MVLAERDVESWYKSFDAAVIQTAYNPVYDFIARLDEDLRPMNSLGHSWFGGLFKSKDRKELEKKFSSSIP